MKKEIYNDVEDIEKLIQKYQKKLKNADTDIKKKKANIMLKMLDLLRKEIVGDKVAKPD
jgi:peptidoglycan hydrolase CwlO-like protein